MPGVNLPRSRTIKRRNSREFWSHNFFEGMFVESDSQDMLGLSFYLQNELFLDSDVY